MVELVTWWEMAAYGQGRYPEDDPTIVEVWF